MIRNLGDKTPKIHPSVFVSEAAYIVGDVEIGENSSVWPGAVIRGDYGKIVIGRACSIQDNCVLHTDDYLELGDNVLMTHGAAIHGGRVGNNVLIGMNATLLEDAHVGNYCLIGAGAVVGPRPEFRTTPWSLVCPDGCPTSPKPKRNGSRTPPPFTWKMLAFSSLQAWVCQFPSSS